MAYFRQLKEVVEKTDYVISGIPLGFPFLEPNVEKVMSFDFNRDDVLLAGYPESGNMLLAELIWRIINTGETSDASDQRPIAFRIPFMELKLLNKEAFVDKLMSAPPPRLMNTHLPYTLMKDALAKNNPKVIVLMRNPKDLAVCFYHFYQTRPGRAVRDFGEFFNKFIQGDIIFGDWFSHTQGWWQLKGHSNYLFVTYEDLQLDRVRSVGKLSRFIKKTLSDEEIQDIVDLSFGSMPDQVAVKTFDNVKQFGNGINGITHTGVIGEWRRTLSKEQSDKIDELLQSKRGHSGPKLVFELASQ